MTENNYTDEYFSKNWEYWFDVREYCDNKCEHYEFDDDGISKEKCCLTGNSFSHRFSSEWALLKQCPILEEIQKKVNEDKKVEE